MNKITNASRFLFEELVSRIQERSNAVGIAVAIVDRNGNTQYEKFFGYRDQERKLPIDEDTIFGLASVTKSFVALSIMQLVEAGKVDLDDPVSKYIPEFTNRNQKPIKVWHFLCHTAGFYPMHRTIINEIAQKAGLDENETGDFAFCEKIALEGTKAVAELLDAQTKENGGLIGDPGNYMSYCNDGFGLLSEIVRRVGGENSFAEYVKKHILEPLHMERSSGEYVRPAADANAAILYKMQKGVMTSGRDYHDNAFSLGGAGSLKSTLADMKKYICMYLNYGKGIDGTRILSQEGVRTMCRPRIDYRPESHYCFGLSQKKLDDLTVMEHGGSRREFRQIYPGRMMLEWALWYCATRRACRLARLRMQQCGCIMEEIRSRTDLFIRRRSGMRKRERRCAAPSVQMKITISRSLKKMEIWQSKRERRFFDLCRCRNF